ncbi:MAG: AI-2E family transporter, partial [Bacteroidota bacterium]
MANRPSKKRKNVAPPSTGADPLSVTTDVRRPVEAILIVGSLLLLLFLVYTIQPVLSPFLVLGAILFLLYPLRRQPLVRNIMWLALMLFLIWFFNELSGLLLPFMIAFLLAYLLDPLVERLQKKGVARWVSTLGVMLFIVGAGVSVLIFVLPVAFSQLDDMLQWVTSMVNDVATTVREGRLVALLQGYGLPVERLQQILNEEFTPRLENIMRALIEAVFGFIASISTIVTRIINAIIIPFLAFYLLKDYPIIRDRLQLFIPLSRRESVMNSLQKVDALLGRYLRGALTVAVINGLLASVLLLLVPAATVPAAGLAGDGSEEPFDLLIVGGRLVDGT